MCHAGGIARSASVVGGGGTGGSGGDSLLCPDIVLSYSGVSLGSGELAEPLGLTSDTRGFIYVADGMAGKIYRYSTEEDYVEFEEPGNYASIYPVDITCVGSFLYVLDYTGNRILRYDYRGAYLDVLVTFEDTDIDHPSSLTATFDGRFITTDSFNRKVTIWSPFMDFQMALGAFESGREGLISPSKALMLRDGRVVVLDSRKMELKYFSAAGTVQRSVKLTESSGFLAPRYICSDKYNNIFIADPEAGKLFVAKGEGDICAVIDSCCSVPIAPSAVALGWNGELFVADIDSRSIHVYKLSYTVR